MDGLSGQSISGACNVTPEASLEPSQQGESYNRAGLEAVKAALARLNRTLPDLPSR